MQENERVAIKAKMEADAAEAELLRLKQEALMAEKIKQERDAAELKARQEAQIAIDKMKRDQEAA